MIFVEERRGDNAGKESIDVAKYGKILASGWGKDPDEATKAKIRKEFTYEDEDTDNNNK